MKIEIVDEAKEDLIRGYWFYEEQARGLWTYFLDSIFADIDSFLLYAGVHRVVYGSHRHLASRFPFAIYYRIEADVVRVRAALDCRRNPKSIQGRLRSAK